jgi:Ceramidase
MSKQLFLRFLGTAFFFTLGMVAIWACLNTCLSGIIWEGMTISKSALTVEYCEFNNVEKLFHQSMNTYSNLAYFFFGVLLLQIAKYDFNNNKNTSQNRFEKFPLLSALMGCCFIYLSFGSAFFHASLTYLGQRVDMNGTYSISIALLGIGIYHLLHKIDFSETAKKLWIGGLLVIIVAFLPISLMISSSKLLPAMILLLMISIAIHYIQFRKQKSFILAILGFVLMFVAVKIRTLDVQKINCDPHSFYQGHSVWHLLTAMSSFCSYAFFRFSKTQP